MQPPQGPNSPQYDVYPPRQPDDQPWIQRPLPGQNQNAWQAPGQPPPPAQIVQDPAQTPFSGVPPQGPGFGAPVQGNAGQPQNGSMSPDAQQQAQSASGQGGYQVPQTGFPPANPKKSHVGSILLIVIALGFAAFAAVRFLAPGQIAYGYVRLGSQNDLYTGDALVVRSETVYAQENVSQIEYKAEEGSLVKIGDKVANIYTAGFNAKEWVTLKNYQNQIKEYHKTLIENDGSDAQLTSVMTAVRTRVKEVRQLVQGASGSFSKQEDLLTRAMQDQQIYIKQKYQDDQKLKRLYDDENGQKQRISTWTKQFASVGGGLISFYTDGYEKELNMSTYADYSPAQVREMYNGKIPESGETQSRNSVDVYRLVRLEPWVVLMLCKEQEWTPIAGQKFNLIIESYNNIKLEATVINFSKAGGELLVRLMIDKADEGVLSNVLYIRSCQVQLHNNVATLTVPSRAIFIQNGRKGVVMVTEGGQYWTPVEVISDDGGTAYIIPDNTGVLYDGVVVRLF